MNRPDDKVISALERIDMVLSQLPVDFVELKADVIYLLEHLSSAEGRTDANCRAVDSHFCLDEIRPNLELPSDFRGLFVDIGGALHDTVAHPEIATNFDSTPEQLLARARKLNTEQSLGGDALKTAPQG